MRIECPVCRQVNDVDISSGEALREAASATCPNCGYDLSTLWKSVRAEMPTGITLDEGSEVIDLDFQSLGGDVSFSIDGSVTATRLASAPPRLVGHYEIMGLIGSGSMGEVFEGWDRRLGRRVAIKMARGDVQMTAQEASMLVAEARAAAKLRHPGIVQVYDLEFCSDGRCAVVMEYVAGESLRDRIARCAANGQRVSPVEAARWMAQASDAVHHAHQKGLVHRDLKPGNALIDELGNLRITDFGLALLEDQAHKHAGEVAGTWPYMSPEQVRGETRYLDGRCDIWAIGVMLYELLTGRRPFTSSSATIRDEILHREPKPPRQIDDSIPPMLEEICLRCLAKDLDKRYRTAADVARDLKAFLAQVERRGVTAGRRRRWLSWSLAITCSLLIVAAFAVGMSLRGTHFGVDRWSPASMSVDPRTLVRDFSHAERFRWIPLLDRSPVRFFGVDSPTQAWHYHPSAQVVSLMGFGRVYVVTGWTEAPNFSLSVRVQIPQTAAAGLLLGLRPVDGRPDEWTSQTIVVTKSNLGPPTLWRRFYWGKIEEEDYFTYIVPHYGGYPVEISQTNSNLLEVDVAGNTVTGVRWNMKPFEQLVDQNLAQPIDVSGRANTNCLGFFGLFIHTGNAQFSDFRFRRD